jgi:hypothetical protein
MIRSSWLAVTALLWAGPLVAQTVIRPDPPLDPARAAMRDALLVLRDSLATIDGAAARLQRDFRQASGPSLVSRARVMEEACARSVRTVPPTRRALLDAQLSEPRRVTGRRDLLRAIDHLGTNLSRCKATFAAMSRPGQGETVRGYGNDRAMRVQSAIRRYEDALRSFVGVMGIKLTPLGADDTPMSG